VKTLHSPPDEALAALVRILGRRHAEVPTTPEGLREWLESRPETWAWVVCTRPHLTIPAGITDREPPGVIVKIRSANLPLDSRAATYWRLLCRLEGLGPAEARRYLADMPDHCAALLALLEGQP